MFLWIALAVLEIAKATAPPYEKAVPDVGGTVEINKNALINVILPKLQAEETAFETALAAAVTCPDTAEFTACKACVKAACLAAAETACTESPLTQEPATSLINNYGTYYLPCEVVKDEPSLDVTAEKAAVAAMVTATGSRRRKRSATPPTCDDFNTKREACQFYVAGCSATCTDVCPLYNTAVTERDDFKQAVLYYGDFSLSSLNIDYATFSAPNGFEAWADVVVGGKSRTVQLSALVFPYDTSGLGTQIANDAIAEVNADPPA